MKVREVKVNNIKIGGGNPLVLIAGPCVIESESHAFNVAKSLKLVAEDLGFPLIFKSSYDKANRTSLSSFRGPGLKKGLAVLKKIKENARENKTDAINSFREIEKIYGMLSQESKANLENEYEATKQHLDLGNK